MRRSLYCTPQQQSTSAEAEINEIRRKRDDENEKQKKNTKNPPTTTTATRNWMRTRWTRMVCALLRTDTIAWPIQTLLIPSRDQTTTTTETKILCRKMFDLTTLPRSILSSIELWENRWIESIHFFKPKETREPIAFWVILCATRNATRHISGSFSLSPRGWSICSDIVVRNKSLVCVWVSWAMVPFAFHKNHFIPLNNRLALTQSAIHTHNDSCWALHSVQLSVIAFCFIWCRWDNIEFNEICNMFRDRKTCFAGNCRSR